MLEIHLNGCHFDKKAMTRYRSRLSSVLGSAPTGSELFSYIERDPNGYSGVVRVHSDARDFVAYGSGKNPTKLLSELSGTVSHQIDDWKAQVLSS